MKTDDLISAIAADAAAPRAPIGRTVCLGAGLAVVTAAIVFAALLPMRPDMAVALGDAHFLFKWAFTLTLLLTAMALIMRLARPEKVPGLQLLILLAAPLVLALGVASELLALPSSEWMPTMVGTNAWGCMIFIPILSAVPLVVLIIALRQGAPARPALTGAVAGLAAAGMAATFYAMHCQNDSPLFLAAWYVLATAIVVTAGSLLGARLLRW
ncbi:MAG: DUF1109 domain-containing protein [Hyphomicrobium sp.]|uniref:DUF1109 domain-containing protein n=1 Tax=Hyphomicrobium sp. TaxID=82 RepID=UPI00132825C4|nr:DUF1109 domain-containing protein [Hyphomicrobium sp.]KAB2942622.1 MAG: DUF1109 family protein [Hyphomicrobium sp.]MBZ0208606.1 DUF1109 domain-containing protein [Hyphomicrobium sp.]